MDTRKLPVLAIFQEALSLPAMHYRMLLKAGFPLILTIVLFIVYQHFNQADGQAALFNLPTIIFMIVFVLTLVMAIVGCHRIFLMEPDVVETASIFHWTGNEIKYIGWWVVIGLAAILLAAPFFVLLVPFISSFIDEAGDSQLLLVTLIFCLNIFIAYFVSRWSLVLPSCAIDRQGHSISWSWGLSSGNGWRLTLLIAGFPLLMDALIELLPDFDSVIYTLVIGAFWLVLGVIQVGLLSLSYAFLASDDTAQNQSVSNAIQ